MILLYTVVSLCSFVVLNALRVSPCAKWNTTGITVLGTGAAGDASDQLNLPQGLFLHKESNLLYVADTGNRRVQMLELNQSSMVAQRVVSNVDSLSSVFVDDDGTSIYVTLRFVNRLERWIRGASSGEQLGDQCKQCSGVWLDAEKNIYMSESGTHSILKWSTQTNTSITVAGRTDEQQQTADHLYFPRGIFVSRTNGTLYIADTMNNRIQRWVRDAQEGTTVAGAQNGMSGRDPSTLASPQSVWVDEDSGIVYIADTENDRIQRWLPQQSMGSTIAGGSGRGKGNNQLSQPNALAFDNLGNLYVCDGRNHRVQMFQLVENETCPASGSHSMSFDNSMHLTHFLLLSWMLMNLCHHFFD